MINITRIILFKFRFGKWHNCSAWTGLSDYGDFLVIFRPSLRADRKREPPCTDWRPCRGRVTFRWTWWAIIRPSRPNSAWDRWCWRSRRSSAGPRRRSWGARPPPRPRCPASWACVCCTAVRRRCILFGFCNLNRYADRGEKQLWQHVNTTGTGMPSR